MWVAPESANFDASVRFGLCNKTQSFTHSAVEQRCSYDYQGCRKNVWWSRSDGPEKSAPDAKSPCRKGRRILTNRTRYRHHRHAGGHWRNFPRSNFNILSSKRRVRSIDRHERCPNHVFDLPKGRSKFDMVDDGKYRRVWLGNAVTWARVGRKCEFQCPNCRVLRDGGQCRVLDVLALQADLHFRCVSNGVRHGDDCNGRQCQRPHNSADNRLRVIGQQLLECSDYVVGVDRKRDVSPDNGYGDQESDRGFGSTFHIRFDRDAEAPERWEPDTESKMHRSLHLHC